MGKNLSELKESHPVETVEFCKNQETLMTNAAFLWWVPTHAHTCEGREKMQSSFQLLRQGYEK